jgi:hypothetical protein
LHVTEVLSERLDSVDVLSDLLATGGVTSDELVVAWLADRVGHIYYTVCDIIAV